MPSAQLAGSVQTNPAFLRIRKVNRLADPNGELYKRGIIIENFVIESIGLDRDYVGQIKARQVAMACLIPSSKLLPGWLSTS